MVGMRTQLACLVVPYLWLQAITVALWWLCLWLVPAARPPFVIDDWPEATLFAWALPDLAVIVLGSALVAHGLRRQSAWAQPLLAALAGVVVYATLYCGGALLATGSGWLSAAMMLGSSAGTLTALYASRR
jgi:hypothetical protein